MLRELKRGNGDEVLFSGGYPLYVKVFQRALADFGAPREKVVPSCTRHSGASIDRARKTRMQEDITKRGRWGSLKSAATCNNGAALTASWALLTPDLNAWCEDYERHLEATVVHGNTRVARFQR